MPVLRWRWPHWLGLGLLMLASAPFALYAAIFGLRGLGLDLSEETRFALPGAALSSAAIFVHMAAGGLITLLAPLQIVGPLRRRWPRLHRTSGYLIAPAAIMSAIGGLAFIGLRGTIGGPLMDGAFAGYGLCMLVAAAQTLRFARARDYERHFEWAVRLVVLAMGSWIYRAHYTLWYLATGGIGSERDFSGPFDQIQVFAFYVPYLALVELYLQRRRGAYSAAVR